MTPPTTTPSSTKIASIIVGYILYYVLTITAVSALECGPDLCACTVSFPAASADVDGKCPDWMSDTYSRLGSAQCVPGGSNARTGIVQCFGSQTTYVSVADTRTQDIVIDPTTNETVQDCIVTSWEISAVNGTLVARYTEDDPAPECSTTGPPTSSPTSPPSSPTSPPSSPTSPPSSSSASSTTITTTTAIANTLGSSLVMMMMFLLGSSLY